MSDYMGSELTPQQKAQDRSRDTIIENNKIQQMQKYIQGQVDFYKNYKYSEHYGADHISNKDYMNDYSKGLQGNMKILQTMFNDYKNGKPVEQNIHELLRILRGNHNSIVNDLENIRKRSIANGSNVRDTLKNISRYS